MERIDKKNLFSAELMARRWLAPGILELRLSRPSHFRFIPGQFVRFAMDGYERDYTMVSAPDADTIDFCIAIVDKGRFSNDIKNADIGTAFQLSGPHGHFVFQGPVNPAIFVATGTGVAPFVAFCRDGGVDAACLLHGVGTPERLIYRRVLQPALHRYVPCINRPFENHNDLDYPYAGRVTQYLEKQVKAGTYDFYICGRRTMIRDVTAVIDEQFGDSRLFIETYD